MEKIVIDTCKYIEFISKVTLNPILKSFYFHCKLKYTVITKMLVIAKWQIFWRKKNLLNVIKLNF